MPLLNDDSCVNEHFQLLILSTLKEQPKHGHLISQEIQAFIGKKPGPGSLYGTLYRLVEKRYIERLPMEGRRQPFEITSAGRHFLDLQVRTMKNVVNFVTRESTE